MAFEKGKSGNPHGRPPGSKNVCTSDFREAVALLLNRKSKDFDKWIDRIAKKNPARAMDCITQLAEFATPKLSRVTHSGDADEPIFFKQVEDDIPPDDEPE